MSLSTYAEQWFPVEGMQVRHSQLGNYHEFFHRGRRCVVGLPPSDYIGKDPISVYRQAGDAGAVDGNVTGWWYGIYLLRVAIELDPIDYEGDESSYCSPETSAALGDLHDEIPRMLLEVADHWVKVCRWISQSSHVSFRTGEQCGTHFKPGYRVRRMSDDVMFYGFGGSFVALKRTKIPNETWKLIGEALTAKLVPPLWYDYISEAQIKLRQGDIGGSIASGAIACETVIRAMFWLDIPHIANPLARSRVEDVAAQALLSRWSEIAGISATEAKASGKSQVHKLFGIRNDYMHRGDLAEETAKDIKDILKSAEKFIHRADELYRARRGLKSVHVLDDSPS